MCIDYIFYIIFSTFKIYYLEYIYEKCLKYSIDNYIIYIILMKMYDNFPKI